MSQCLDDPVPGKEVVVTDQYEQGGSFESCQIRQGPEDDERIDELTRRMPGPIRPLSI
jgi:hypothetical protein